MPQGHFFSLPPLPVWTGYTVKRTREGTVFPVMPQNNFLFLLPPLPLWTGSALEAGEEGLHFPSCPGNPFPPQPHGFFLAAGMLLRGFAALPGRAALFDLGLRPLLVVPARGRKSRHDPPAKSKADRINRPQPMDATEHLVLRHRYQMYRQIVEALRAEFKANILQEVYMKKFGEVEQQKKQAAELEHRRLMEWNDAENRRLQAIREERLQQAEMAERERRLQVAQSRAAMEEAVQKEREEEVLQLQEEAKNFITPENLDKRIEECLDNPKNYNFAIDKEGRIAKRTVLF